MVVVVLIVTSGCCVHVRPFLLGIMLLSRLLSLGVVAEPPYAIKSDRGDGVAPSPPNHQLLSDEIRYRIVIIKLWLRGSGRGRGGIGSGSGHGVQSFNLPNEAFNKGQFAVVELRVDCRSWVSALTLASARAIQW